MDNRQVRAGPGINARFAKMIEREEAKAAAEAAAASKEDEQAPEPPMELSGAVVRGMFSYLACLP